jgi:hypothetical protein
MNKSKLRHIIREEISTLLKEGVYNPEDEIVSRGIEYGINPESSDDRFEGEISHDGESCDKIHSGLSHEEWEFEQSKKDSPEFWKKIWKVQR